MIADSQDWPDDHIGAVMAMDPTTKYCNANSDNFDPGATCTGWLDESSGAL